MTSTNPVVSSRSGSRYFASSLAAGTIILLAAACSTSSGSGPNPITVQTICGPFKVNQPDATTCATPGGEVKGVSDSHCSKNGKPVAQAITACPMGAVDSGTGASDSATSSDDSGSTSGNDAGSVSASPDDGTCGDSDYQPTMNNHSGSDDDCKYDVSWTSTPICESGNVYFTVTVKKRAFADGGSAVGGDEPPMTGGTVSAESTLDCAPALKNPSTVQNFVEDPVGSGTYKVGPVLFDKKGKWDVRFHFNECCNDGPTSPHGHAAFWVNVP